MSGGLLVVATPIGNLGDLSPRAAEALRAADLVACEDTRRTATLLRHAGSSAKMLATHEHNEAARAEELVARVQSGEQVVLVSDAGLPSISDPGQRVVAAFRAAGLDVSVIPGPSAVESALGASGFVAEPYLFVGFFPRKDGDRTALLDRADATGGAVVGFESPKRIAKMYVKELFKGLMAENFPKITVIENDMKYDQMIVVRDVKVISTCEHHFVTIDGKATIAYIPAGKVIGLSKINRIADFFSRRPQVQERLTKQIADCLVKVLDTEHVAVHINAKHYCVVSRGVQDSESTTVTSDLRGDFKRKSDTRFEFLSHCSTKDLG